MILTKLVSFFVYVKSSEGSAILDLTKVYYGMQMQMMTYMDIVLQNKQRLGLTDIVKPGGLFHVHGNIIIRLVSQYLLIQGVVYFVKRYPCMSSFAFALNLNHGLILMKIN
jgi:hypothetical protein